jgi:hypothetical protein
MAGRSEQNTMIMPMGVVTKLASARNAFFT